MKTSNKYVRSRVAVFFLVLTLMILLVPQVFAEPAIGFMSPTPPNVTVTANTSVLFNISINESNLGEFKWIWNNTNYTLYNDSLVLMMNFDNLSFFGENSSSNFTLDSSTYNNNGSCVGMGIGCILVDGKQDKAINLDGINDYVSIPDANPLKPQNITVAAWVKFNRLNGYTATGGAPNNFGSIVFKQNTRAGQFAGYMLFKDGADVFVFELDNSAGTQTSASSTTKASADVWYFVVGTFQRPNIKIYVNGNLEGTKTHDSPIDYGTNTINIGTMVVGSWNTFNNASIDSVKIYNRTLSDSEIKKLYYSSMSKYNSTNWIFLVNESDLEPPGNYTYNYSACSKDIAGNQNCTETREITIQGVSPSIGFVSPTPPNATMTTNTSVIFNVSINESNLRSTIFTWNGINSTLYNQNLVLFMNLDNKSFNTENATRFMDESINKQNASCEGTGCPTIVAGYSGKALSFDGGDKILFDFSNANNLSGQFTLSAWVKINSFSAWDRIIVRDHTSCVDPYAMFHLIISDTQKALIGATNESGDYAVTGTTTINTGAWYHLTGVYNGTNLLIYVNGTLENTSVFSGNVRSNKQPLGIGNGVGACNEPFNGIIDEPRIWKQALTSAEVNDTFRNTYRLYQDSLGNWSYVINQTTTTNGTFNYSATAEDSVGNLNTTEIITIKIGNNLPTLDDPVFNVSIVTKTSGIKANTTYTDLDGEVGTVYFRWFRNWTEVFTDNYTSIPTGTIVNSTLSTALYNKGDLLNITAYANDGYNNSATVNSSTLTVASTAPTHGTPILNSTLNTNTTAENLTVYNISTADIDNDYVRNIYQWYRNEQPFAQLNMPFEAPSNTTDTKDYAFSSRSLLIQSGVVYNATEGFDGGGTYTFNGLAGKAIRVKAFDATGDSGQQLTLSAWVKPLTTSAGSVVISHSDFSTTDRGYGILVLPNYSIRVIFSEDGGVTNYKQIETSTLSPFNAWTHIAVTWKSNGVNSGDCDIYFNGVNESNKRALINGQVRWLKYSNERPVVIGGQLSNNASVNTFNGSIDSVLIFNTTLTSQQIQLIYQNKTNMIDSSLLVANDVWNASITPNDGVDDGATTFSNNITILVANTVPTLGDPVFNVSTVTKSSGIKANTTYTDVDNSNGNVYFRWYRNWTEIFTDNYTSIPSGTIVNSTLSTTLYNKGDLLNVTVYANDGTDNSATVNSSTLTVANSAPTLNDPVFNVSTATKNSGIKANTTYIDADAQSGTIYFRWYRNWTEVFTDNYTSIPTGTIVNSTLSNTLYNRGDLVNITIYANDGNDNSATVNSSTLTIANIVPTVDVPVFNVTNITPNGGVKANTTYKDVDSDGATLYFRWFANGTEIFTNNQSSIAANAIVTSTLTSALLSAGDLLNVTVYANDGDNSAVQESITDTVWADISLLVELLTPENGTRKNNLNQEFNFNVTGLNVTICSLYNNASGTFQNISSISTITQHANSSITHNNIPENDTIVWNIVCISNTGVEFRAQNNFSLNVDRTLPLLTFASPVRSNGTMFISSSVGVNVSCSDTSDLFEFLANITNATGQSIYQNLTTAITGTAFELAPTINFANNASGAYRINVQCSDDHTRKAIKTYSYTKDLTKDLVKFQTKEDTNITIQAIYSDLKIRDITAERSAANDRYHFIYDWKQKGSPDYTFIYQISSTYPVYYRNNSNYTAHFVTSENWVDFEGVNGTFTVYQNATGWYVKIVTNETYHNFSSIGGLNIVEENVSFVYDVGFDIANATAVTATPASIRQDDIVSFNATFNVTGVSNASGMNVTLTVDNSYVTGTSVTVVSGVPQQVELNWTAVPGIHTIRLNADANNTITEILENNNNATATITVYNISVLNLSTPITGTEIIRGKDTASLPGEDTLKKVSNFTTILARVYNKNAPSVGVYSNCTYYLNTTYLGFNTTNTTGECSLTFDHTLYNASVYNITVNFTNLNTTDYLADVSTALIQNSTIVDLSKVEIDLDADNMRTGGVYNPGDVAVMNITVTKNSTAYDPNKFTVVVKNPGAECNAEGGILYNHSYPGDIVRISTGLYQSYSVLTDDTDIHWCVIINNSASTPLASASHSDKEVTDTGANMVNFTVINTASAGDDAVFDDMNISFKTVNNYTIFDTNFSSVGAENRLITLNDKYNVLFKHPQRQEQLSITELNITSANMSLPFNFLTSYSGAVPVNFTNTTTILAFNNSGFVFTIATITLQKSGLTFDKIMHCTNWNFTGGYCLGSWEINTTADYSGFNQNATHFWFNVNSFSAYAGGNGTNSQLQIYDSAEGSYAEVGSSINFTANYTRVADNVSITDATCTFNTSTTLYDMTYDSTKQVYNYTVSLTPANYSWTVSCSKGISFDNLNATDTIDVRDTIAPSVSTITPIEVSNDQSNTYSATVTDAGGIATCYFVVDGVNRGLMDYNGTTATMSAVLSTATSKTFTVYANCTDNVGNNAYNSSGVSIYLPDGNGQQGSSKAASSTAATADGLEAGIKYTGLKAGDSFSSVNVKVVSVYPNSVRLDVAGLYNIVLLEGLFRKLDLNQDGVPETTIYVDKVVAYSNADITVLVEGDSGIQSKEAAQQSFSLLGDLWSRIKERVTAEEPQQEPIVEQPVLEQPESVSVATKPFMQKVQEQTIAVWSKVKSLSHVFSSGKITGAIVYEETADFFEQDILSSIQMKLAVVIGMTVVVILPLVTGSYVFRRACKKRADKIALAIKEEIKYRGLR